MTKRKFMFLFAVMIILVLLINYKTILKKVFPLQYSQSVVKYSKEYDVDPFIIYAIIRVESKFNPYAKSNKGAMGLMQITPQTGKYIAELLNTDNYEESKLYNTDLNIQFGAFYFSKLYNDFNRDVDCALAAYNGGRGNVNKWIETNSEGKSYLDVAKIPFQETKNYVIKVRRIYELYRFIYTDKV